VNCGTCKFFYVAEEKSPEGLIVGECKRFPRVSVDMDDDSKWMYPLQFDQDICGEFLRRIEGV
jgi:hypothetical protein